MGSNHSKEIHLNKRIFLNLEEIGRSSIDEVFVDCLRIMRKIEEMRRQFSLRWNSLCEKSGAIVILKPSFKSVIEGMLWKLSVNLEISIAGVFQLELTNPYLKILKSDSLPSDANKKQEIFDLQESYTYFMDYFWEKFDIIDDLYKEINNNFTRVKEEKSTVLNSFNWNEK
jgi:hypothetical protein